MRRVGVVRVHEQDATAAGVHRSAGTGREGREQDCSNGSRFSFSRAHAQRLELATAYRLAANVKQTEACNVKYGYARTCASPSLFMLQRFGALTKEETTPLIFALHRL